MVLSASHKTVWYAAWQVPSLVALTAATSGAVRVREMERSRSGKQANKKKPKADLNVEPRTRSPAISAWIKIMWNSIKVAALALAGAGFAAATPALACFDWGYSGGYSHGWPYANTGFTS